MRKTLSVLLVVIMTAFAPLAFAGQGQDETATASTGQQSDSTVPEKTSSLSLKVHHLFMAPSGQDTLRVSERFIINNAGDTVSADETFIVSLPDAYQDLQFLEGIDKNSAQVKDGKLVISRSIPSGTTNLGFGYVIKSDTPHFIINEEVRYPTEVVYILTPAQGIDISGNNIQDGGIQNVEGQQYRLFIGEGFQPGDNLGLRVTLTGSVSGASGGVTREGPEFHSPGHIRFWKQSPFAGMNAHIFLFLIIVLPTGLIGYALYKRRQYAQEMASEKDEEEELFQRLMKKQHSLLGKLKDLEKQRLNEEIDEETYAQLREVYKKKLIKVKAKLKELAG